MFATAALLLAVAVSSPPRAATASTDVAGAVAAAAAARDDGDEHPLPLAGSWNAGTQPGGFDPSWQLEALRGGARLLPWFNLQPPWRGGAARTHDRVVREYARLGLPLSFVGPEWEFELPDDPRYFLPVATDAPATARRGPPFPPLSPDSPLTGWYEAGRRWARHPLLERMQQLHPRPPRVLFVSNNEYPRPRWRDSPRWRDADGRRALGDAWVARYRELLRGFREGLREPQWRAVAVFAGYEAFAGNFQGRWSDWLDYTLSVPGRIDPWSLAWDGASVSYYLHDWSPDTDYTVWSPQVEAMNFLPALAEARDRNPAFWLEMSVWDGQQRGLATDKAAFFRQRGQQWDPERYRGMLQFGMWLLRPRTVREFRNPGDDRASFGPWFDAVLAAVAQVHDDATLREFWRRGRLVRNDAARHPYGVNPPPDMESRGRWALLGTSSDPPRPWDLQTELPVYALALELGAAPRRRWLVYAHSPRAARLPTQVRLPDGRDHPVEATRGGSFTLVDETQAMAPEPQR